MAHVYKRNKTYWVRFCWQGKEYRRSAFTTSKTVARDYLVQLLEEKRRIARGGRPRHTYQSALHRYSQDYLPTLKPATQERYRGSFRQLEPFIGKLHLDEITKSVLASFVSASWTVRVMAATSIGMLEIGVGAVGSEAGGMIDVLSTRPGSSAG